MKLLGAGLIATLFLAQPSVGQAAATPDRIAGMTEELILPMTAHVALTALLYVLLTAVRAPAIWGIGRRPDGTNPWAAIEPRISANLSNQFELPLFFYAACMILQLDQVSPVAISLAWTFVGGRLLHTAVQIFTRNVRLRGAVFTINFLAVLGLWLLVAWPGDG
jgi:hypothetical protein